MQYGMSTTNIFLDYDADELNRQYDQSAWAANAETVINRYGVDSNAVRVRLGEPQVMAYGALPRYFQVAFGSVSIIRGIRVKI